MTSSSRPDRASGHPDLAPESASAWRALPARSPTASTSIRCTAPDTCATWSGPDRQGRRRRARPGAGGPDRLGVHRHRRDRGRAQLPRATPASRSPLRLDADLPAVSAYHGFEALGKELSALPATAASPRCRRASPSALLEAVAVSAEPAGLGAALGTLRWRSGPARLPVCADYNIPAGRPGGRLAPALQKSRRGRDLRNRLPGRRPNTTPWGNYRCRISCSS